jgi:hypothetical protein
VQDLHQNYLGHQFERAIPSWSPSWLLSREFGENNKPQVSAKHTAQCHTFSTLYTVSSRHTQADLCWSISNLDSHLLRAWVCSILALSSRKGNGLCRLSVQPPSARKKKHSLGLVSTFQTAAHPIFRQLTNKETIIKISTSSAVVGRYSMLDDLWHARMEDIFLALCILWKSFHL